MVLGYVFEPADVAIVLTLVFLEGVLSFDNAAVLAAMVRRLPPDQRRRALLYGMAGAYLFRLLAILSVSFLAANPWLKIVGGGYLVYLAATHLVFAKPHEREAKPAGLLARMGLSGFWGVVAAVELADAAFALDQVLAAVAMTEKTLLVVAASFAAIVLLRLSAASMSRLMDWFPALEKLAYGAVGFVGVKLLAVEAAHKLGHPEFEVPKAVSIGVTLGLLAAPVLAKLAWERLRPASRRA